MVYVFMDTLAFLLRRLILEEVDVQRKHWVTHYACVSYYLFILSYYLFSFHIIIIIVNIGLIERVEKEEETTIEVVMMVSKKELIT